MFHNKNGRKIAQCKVCIKLRDEIYRGHNKIKIAKKKSTYYSANSHIRAAAQARRRAKLSVGVEELSRLETSMIEALYFIRDILSNSCGEDFHIDHINPLAKGGLHKFNNLQILSKEENLKKGSQ